MMNKLLVWGTVFGIISVIIFPIIYFIFSFWWLLSGEMVTRLTYFSTSSITSLTITILAVLISIRKGVTYRDGTERFDKVKKLYKNFLGN